MGEQVLPASYSRNPTGREVSRARKTRIWLRGLSSSPFSTTGPAAPFRKHDAQVPTQFGPNFLSASPPRPQDLSALSFSPFPEFVSFPGSGPCTSPFLCLEFNPFPPLVGFFLSFSLQPNYGLLCDTILRCLSETQFFPSLWSQVL